MLIVVARIVVRLFDVPQIIVIDHTDGIFHYGTEFTCKKKRGLFHWMENSNSSLATATGPVRLAAAETWSSI